MLLRAKICKTELSTDWKGKKGEVLQREFTKAVYQKKKKSLPRLGKNKKWSIFLAILQPHAQLHIHNTTIMTIWQGSIFSTVKRIQSKTKKVKKLSSQANSPQGKSNVAITSQSPIHMTWEALDVML